MTERRHPSFGGLTPHSRKELAPKVHPAGRRCVRCYCVLSVYNPNDRCSACGCGRPEARFVSQRAQRASLSRESSSSPPEPPPVEKPDYTEPPKEADDALRAPLRESEGDEEAEAERLSFRIRRG